MLLCVTNRAFRCSFRGIILSSVVNFVVQFYLSSKENKFRTVTYGKYFVKYVL